MGKPRRTLLALSAAILAVPLAGAVPAYADATTGSISGQLSTAGVVRTDVYVTLYSSAAGFVGAVNVDGTGAFHFTDLVPGSYQVEFGWGNGLGQWYRGKPVNGSQPDPVTVVAGQDTVVNDSTLPTGTITGTLTDADGNPLPQVEAYASSTDVNGSAFGFTDANGHYTIEALAGGYHLSFTPSGYATDYVPHSPTPAGASVLTVTAGQVLAVDEQLPSTGSISGRYTTADGQPVAHAFVSTSTADGYGNGGYAQTGDDGTYKFPHLYAGSYKVQFTSPEYVTQYATGKLTIDAADVFTVTAGADTVVNDSELPVGSIAVTATDSVTHQPIADFCAGADGQQACSNGSGTATVNNVRQGNQSLYVYSPDNHYFGVNDQVVSVTGGQTTGVAVSLRPAATIKTVITDALTGAPVPWVCVAPLSPGDGEVPESAPYCADDQGNLNIGPLDPGSYILYVGPRQPYGAQYVGASGGVGNPAKARTTNVTVGATVTVPAIRLDHAGTVAGIVRDSSGHPVSGALVTSSAFDPGPGPGGPTAFTDSAGHYSLSGLGPYQWPLLFIGNDGLQQWSGGVPDRTVAKTVKLFPDATVTYDMKLVTGVTVSGGVLAGGAPAGDGRVIAYNTATGETIGVAELDHGTYHLHVLGSQRIRLRYETYVQGGPEGWFGGADYAHATSVDIHKKDVTLNLTVG